MTSRTLMEILQFIILEYLSLTTHYNFTSLTCWNKVRLYFNFNFLRVRSHERRNELIPVWDFKPAWKQVLFSWSFNAAGSQNDPIFWWICIGISFRVVFIWYFITKNEISFLSKWPLWNPYLQWVSKRTWSLNVLSNESALIHFVSVKFCSHENLMPVWNFISVKMIDMKSHTSLGRFGFISPLMWTYFKISE